MRESNLYNRFISADSVRQLHSLYLYDFSLGDQVKDTCSHPIPIFVSFSISSTSSSF